MKTITFILHNVSLLERIKVFFFLFFQPTIKLEVYRSRVEIYSESGDKCEVVKIEKE